MCNKLTLTCFNHHRDISYVINRIAGMDISLEAKYRRGDPLRQVVSVPMFRGREQRTGEARCAANAQM